MKSEIKAESDCEYTNSPTLAYEIARPSYNRTNIRYKMKKMKVI